MRTEKTFRCSTPAAARSLRRIYDALSTAVYPTLSDKMAMKIGSKYKFIELQSRHWEQFATEAALSPAQVKKRVAEIARRLPDLARATAASFAAHGNDHGIVGKIVATIEQRCALAVRRLTAAGEDDGLNTA
jgi:serine/threonine-protein kinase HipA